MIAPALRNVQTGSLRRLAPVSTIGRDPSNLIRLDDPSTSRAHAIVQWDDHAWTLRDLGSIHGTRVGSRRVAGERLALHAGDRITFGKDAEVWELVDASPPQPFAWCPKPRDEVGPSANVLFLSAESGAPAATVFRGREGGWVLERGDEQVAVEDGESIDIDGRVWRLILPDAARVTHAPNAVSLASAVVHLTVSRDWEHVALRLVDRGQELDLGELQCWAVVLLLAQERIRDADGPEHDQGWMDIEQICRDLAMRRGTVDVLITRARQALADRGVVGSERIVVARRGQRRTDLGAGAFVIHQDRAGA